MKTYLDRYTIYSHETELDGIVIEGTHYISLEVRRDDDVYSYIISLKDIKKNTDSSRALHNLIRQINAKRRGYVNTR